MTHLKDLHKQLFNLKGKVAVITGGAGLLGSVFSKAFAQSGATVLVSDTDKKKSEKLVHDLNNLAGNGHLSLQVDLVNETSVKKWATRIINDFGSIDVLVNNAGTKSPNFFTPLESFPLEDWNYVMNVNVTGMFLAIRELGPSMVKKGNGSIINISSIYGVVGPDQRIYKESFSKAMDGSFNTPMVYSSSKGAVIAMTRYLAAYWGEKGIRTNTLTPGGVSSGQNDTFHEKYSKRVPMGRMAKTDDMVGALLFLASDASSYVNGQNIIIDGGLTTW